MAFKKLIFITAFYSLINYLTNDGKCTCQSFNNPLVQPHFEMEDEYQTFGENDIKAETEPVPDDGNVNNGGNNFNNYNGNDDGDDGDDDDDDDDDDDEIINNDDDDEIINNNDDDEDNEKKK
ncbi:conserved Plasmodium protein, unknown function [Plasmodium berghei]|uniref:Parasitophorous vacuolar protein 3 n=2 Tax=Plasmodium berghei TaxID=5821 RepID=A0A509AQD7_PLABA|nr:parasitophorous vacuolar protein 3 [Plasmodium berghei ANKA]CXJ01654.1 conserved Plasmodium protein, unknown function [Plasmodium berghei]SCL98212.1 conserved Plasmodium protein, unknown function [Plasmodium berghei]SCM16778.1 conserved Plasmodium protein, unknown function [Plasmodium berghei]SCM18576.1 conserved Plasmodium protein, unknown function [Plasmodium berghei]SCN28009.1 conserved Plasmodium protein, unknown function [Plasmodium berghei]|eukprot:XP_034423662.1 parasitophorous vacuolar protein 3 [Plasmodium berghei ANKA]